MSLRKGNGCVLLAYQITNAKTTTMKNSEKFNRAFDYFKKGYAYKMGGTQTVALPNGKSKSFDDRQYYSGRGAKFNKDVRHDIIGVVKVSRKDYADFLKHIGQDAETKAKMKAGRLVSVPVRYGRTILTIEQKRHLDLIRQMEAKTKGARSNEYTMRWDGFEFRIPKGQNERKVRNEVSLFMNRVSSRGCSQFKHFRA